MITYLNNNNYIFHFQNNMITDKTLIYLFILTTFSGLTNIWVELMTHFLGSNTELTSPNSWTDVPSIPV